MPEAGVAVETYKQLGVAGLFILMYVTTVWFLIRVLVKQSSDAKAMTEKVVVALEASTSQSKQALDGMKNVSSSVDAQKTMMTEYIAYMKGLEKGRETR